MTRNTKTVADFAVFEPETEALVLLSEWGGIVAPCNIINVYNDGVAVKDVSEITSESTAKVAVYVGSRDDLQYESKRHIFNVSVKDLSL